MRTTPQQLSAMSVWHKIKLKYNKTNNYILWSKIYDEKIEAKDV